MISDLIIKPTRYELLDDEQLCLLDGVIPDDTFIDIYVDGSSYPNPGKASYALAIVADDVPVITITDGFVNSTNNRMELYSLILAWQIANHFTNREINIYSDSQYSIKSIYGNGSFSSNSDLMNLIKEIEVKIDYTNIHKVKAHSGDTWNDYVDNIAMITRTQIK